MSHFRLSMYYIRVDGLANVTILMMKQKGLARWSAS